MGTLYWEPKVLEVAQIDTGTVDTYNAARLSQQELFAKTGLPRGEHTIKIVVKGTKNTASKDCYIIVDAFKVDTKND